MVNKKIKLKITPEVKLCIRRLESCFNKELRHRKPVFNYDFINKRIAFALGIDVRWVYHTLAEEKERKESKLKMKKKKKKKGRKEKAVMEEKTEARQHRRQHGGHNKKLDDFFVDQVRRCVHDMYTNKEFASIKRIVKRLTDQGTTCKPTTVWRGLRRAGFKFYAKHGKRFIKESQEVVASRHSYLRAVRKYRAEGYEIVYLDETWINASHNAPGEWTQNRKGPMSVLYPEKEQSARFIPSGKGKRLIVLDAGSSQSGFIPDVGLIFRSKTKSADYHDEMNSQHFLEWFEHTLLPALTGPAVIVMDNAPYHNTKTTGSWYPRASTSKPEIRRWLLERGVSVDDDEVKAELLMKVRLNRPDQMFQTDLIANQNGHLVMRLPVRHCELNPIELIQAQEKQKVAMRNTTFKLKDVERLYREAKQEIGVEAWRKAERHVIVKVEDRLWALDGVRNDEIEPVIIDFDDDNDDDVEERIDWDSSDDEHYKSSDDEDEDEDEVEHHVAVPIGGGGGDDDDDDDDDDVRPLPCTSSSGMVSSQDVGPSGDAGTSVVVCKICKEVDPPVKVRRQKERVTEWAECSMCERWVHLECCFGKKPKITSAELPSCFACTVCQAVLKSAY